MKQQDIKPKNNKGEAHGLWIRHKKDGNLSYKGNFINDIRYSHWIENFHISKPKIIFYLT